MFSKKKTILFLGDLSLLFISFFLVSFFKNELTGASISDYLFPLLIFLGVWIFLSLISDKYKLSRTRSLMELCIPIFRINFIILAVILIIIYGIKIEITSRLMVFGPIFLSIVLESLFCLIYYFNTRLRIHFDNTDDIILGDITELEIDEEEAEFSEEDLLETDLTDHEKHSIEQPLHKKYLANEPRIFEFLKEYIPITRIKRNNSLVLKTSTTYNIEFIDTGSLTLFINLYRINNIKRINKFFIQVNFNLKNHGYFVGCVETLDLRKRRIFKKFPPVFNWFYYAVDYIYKRVFPKLPVFKQIYFFITRGYNRVISEPETLGRLHSCGFDLVALRYINGLTYFVVKKERKPLLNNNPTYGPLVKLNRVGKGGVIIKIYKFRTMYPYSEYIQGYMYSKNNLAEGGKIDNDYRVTTLGRILRKVWIDELPMFYNVLKGQIKIVGVRPLSRHYFSLYPEEVQKKRINYKPGLIPPFYVDMPKTLEEIIASELKYFNLYDKSPIITDITYFIKAFNNILFKRARSK